VNGILQTGKREDEMEKKEVQEVGKEEIENVEGGDAGSAKKTDNGDSDTEGDECSQTVEGNYISEDLVIRSEETENVKLCAKRCRATRDCGWFTYLLEAKICALQYGPSITPDDHPKGVGGSPRCDVETVTSSSICDEATATALGKEDGRGGRYCADLCRCLTGTGSKDSCKAIDAASSQYGRCSSKDMGASGSKYKSVKNCLALEGAKPISKADGAARRAVAGFCTFSVIQTKTVTYRQSPVSLHRSSDTSPMEKNARGAIRGARKTKTE